MSGSGRFAPGSLRVLTRAASARALASGALLPIPTDRAYLDGGGVRFLVRVLASLAQKQAERERQQRTPAAGAKVNPFLPYERELFVAEVSETHVAILNKYQVVDDHLLVVTREFEEQRSLLTAGDFAALWRCLAEFPSLGFYNGGPEAGASQPHKHLQLVPLPLAPEGPAIPIEPLLPASAPGEIATIPGFGFRHAFTRLGGPSGAAAPLWPGEAYERYAALLARVGHRPPTGDRGQVQSGPYCLLATREWLLLVPRSREHFRSISVNALGFAGALLVWNGEQLRELRAAGPLAALRETALPG